MLKASAISYSPSKQEGKIEFLKLLAIHLINIYNTRSFTFYPTSRSLFIPLPFKIQQV